MNLAAATLVCCPKGRSRKIRSTSRLSCPDLKGKTLTEVADFPVITTEEAQTRFRCGGREPEPAQNEEPDSDVNPDELGNDVDGDDSPR